MASKGVHFMALDSAKARLAASEGEYKQASQQLEEAVKMGDLRENAEYDIAKAAVQRVARERDALTPVITMPLVKSNDNISIIEEGSVIHLVIHNITPAPVSPGTKEFEELKSCQPAFEGTLMYGATLDIHELLTDSALSTDTAIGTSIYGKQPGDYSVAVPAGFANLTVEKLLSSTKLEELGCKL